MKESHRNVIAGSGNVKVSSIICTPSWGRTSNNEAGQFPRQPAGRKQLRVILVKWKQLKWLLVLPSVFFFMSLPLSLITEESAILKDGYYCREARLLKWKLYSCTDSWNIFNYFQHSFYTNRVFKQFFLLFFFLIKVTYCTFPYYLPYKVC